MKNIVSNGFHKDSFTLEPSVLHKFYTAQGWLTTYALSCGYIERTESNGISTTLWKEHGTFHVRQHSDKDGRILWESFESMTEARARFKTVALRFSL